MRTSNIVAAAFLNLKADILGTRNEKCVTKQRKEVNKLLHRFNEQANEIIVQIE